MDEVMTVADAGGGNRALYGSSHPSQNLLPHNLPIFSAFLALALAQFLKVFTNWSVQILTFFFFFLALIRIGLCRIEQLLLTLFVSEP